MIDSREQGLGTSNMEDSDKFTDEELDQVEQACKTIDRNIKASKARFAEIEAKAKYN